MGHKNYFNQQLKQLKSTTLRGNQLPAALKEKQEVSTGI
jgi:hypothetical protein